MNLSYKTIKIMMETFIDRTEAKLDRSIRKPSKDRIILSSPIEFIPKVNEQTNVDELEASIEDFLTSINSRGVLEQIDYELQKNLPAFRYKTLRSFRYNKDWISILESIYVLIRLLKPNLIVETGVGEIGMSSTYILTALEDNNRGYLNSIDPDKFYSLYGYHVGAGIPENLRKRHNLVKGISQTSLEPLLSKLGQIDLFLHDGDHKFRTKLL